MSELVSGEEYDRLCAVMDHDEGCTCHGDSGPCDWCLLLTEAEGALFQEKGRAALRRHIIDRLARCRIETEAERIWRITKEMATGS
jgi:hypothetical protein